MWQWKGWKGGRWIWRKLRVVWTMMVLLLLMMMMDRSASSPRSSVVARSPYKDVRMAAEMRYRLSRSTPVFVCSVEAHCERAGNPLVQGCQPVVSGGNKPSPPSDMRKKLRIKHALEIEKRKGYGRRGILTEQSVKRTSISRPARQSVQSSARPLPVAHFKHDGWQRLVTGCGCGVMEI